MVNLQLTFPSQEPRCVVDIKKERATISLTLQDLTFLSNFSSLLTVTGALEEDEPVTPEPADVAVAGV